MWITLYIADCKDQGNTLKLLSLSICCNSIIPLLDKIFIWYHPNIHQRMQVFDLLNVRMYNLSEFFSLYLGQFQPGAVGI